VNALSRTTMVTYCDHASGLKSLTMAKSRRDSGEIVAC
jgi:hypothetical protein